MSADLGSQMERVWTLTCQRCKHDGIQYGNKATAQRQFEREGWAFVQWTVLQTRLFCPLCVRDTNVEVVQ